MYFNAQHGLINVLSMLRNLYENCNSRMKEGDREKYSVNSKCTFMQDILKPFIHYLTLDIVAYDED